MQCAVPHTGSRIIDGANQAAIDSGIIPQAMLDTPSVFLPADMLSTMFFTEDVGDAEQLYNDAWDELKINLGQ